MKTRERLHRPTTPLKQITAPDEPKLLSINDGLSIENIPPEDFALYSPDAIAALIVLEALAHPHNLTAQLRYKTVLQVTKPNQPPEF